MRSPVSAPLPFFCFFLAASAPLALGEPLSLRDGDRVVLLGNTLIEREQTYGSWETALHLAAGEIRLHVRNLGWSGDTVEGTARSYFGPPEEGFQRLAKDLQKLQPTIVLLGYGAVAAQAGPEGLPAFLEGYRKLLAMIISEANPREIILLSPAPAETLPAPLPDQSLHNQQLSLYGMAIQRLAQDQSLRFVDLYLPVLALKASSPAPLTENGIHYSAEGYRQLGRILIAQLGLSAPPVRETHEHRLRETVIAKNRLFFHRWRPANETYLHGFRKHEQGQNAAELDLFDPLLQAKELEIEVYKKAALSQSARFPQP